MYLPVPGPDSKSELQLTGSGRNHRELLRQLPPQAADQRVGGNLHLKSGRRIWNDMRSPDQLIE